MAQRNTCTPQYIYVCMYVYIYIGKSEQQSVVVVSVTEKKRQTKASNVSGLCRDLSSGFKRQSKSMVASTSLSGQLYYPGSFVLCFLLFPFLLLRVTKVVPKVAALRFWTFP